ncbi:TonB family protein [Yersinia sp. J1]|uniref:energy transducer TonB n=1 Tax=Yersinia sp. J1 TaxID=3424774 RepID=UPI003D35D7FF
MQTTKNSLSAPSDIAMMPMRGRERVRWSGSTVLALLLHGSLICWLAYHYVAADSVTAAPPPALMLVLADKIESVPAPNDVPMGPPKVLSAPESSVKSETERQESVQPAAPEAMKPAILAAKNKVIEKPKPVSQRRETQNDNAPSLDSLPSTTPSAEATSAPPSAAEQRIAAPYTSDSFAQTQGIPDWSSLMLGHLSRHKRYPPIAVRQSRQGIVLVRVTLDKAGLVSATRLMKSSGVDSLDNEALALPKRAQPLPPAPEEIMANRKEISITIPVRFDLRELRN